MPKSEFFSIKNYRLVFWLVTGVFVLYALANLFVVGGDAFIIGMTDSSPILLAFLVTLFSIFLWKYFSPGSAARKVWINFVIGWGAWMLGELAYYLLTLLGEVPYPSIADGLYFFGYVMLARGLFSPLLITREEPTSERKFYFGIISVLFIVAPLLLVVLPIIKNTDLPTLPTTITDVLYAVLDITLLLRVFRLLINYSSKIRTEGWGTLLIGFILMTIADLAYSYTNAYGLYYPEGKVNLVTTLAFSIPYTAAYLLWMLGIFRLRIKQADLKKNEAHKLPVPVDNSHILIFVDNNWIIDETSDNFRFLLAAENVIGSSLQKVLDLSVELMRTIILELPSRGWFSDLPFSFISKDGTIFPAKMDGLRLVSTEGRFTGGILVFYFYNPGKSLDDDLSEYHYSLIKNVKRKSISNEDGQVTEFLNRYYEPIFDRFFELVHTHGGFQQSAILRDTINTLAAENGLSVAWENDRLITRETISPKEFYRQIIRLLEITKDSLGGILDEKEADEVMREVADGYPPEINQSLEYIQKSSLR